MDYLLEISLSIAAFIIAIFYTILIVDYLIKSRNSSSNNRTKLDQSLNAETSRGKLGSDNHPPLYFPPDLHFYKSTLSSSYAWCTGEQQQQHRRRESPSSSRLCYSNLTEDEERKFRMHARLLLESIRRAAFATPFTWLGRLAQPMLRDDGMYELFLDEILEAMAHRKMDRFALKVWDSVDAMIELIESSTTRHITNVTMSDVIVTAQAFSAFCSDHEETRTRNVNEPSTNELILEAQIKKFCEGITKMLGGDHRHFSPFVNMRRPADEVTDETPDENAVEETDNKLVPQNEKNEVLKKPNFTDFRKYVFGHVFSVLTDPTVSMKTKVGYVSTFFLMMVTGITMKHVVTQLKGQSLKEICKPKS